MPLVFFIQAMCFFQRLFMFRAVFVALVVVLAGCAAQQAVSPLDLDVAPPEIAAQYTTRHIAFETDHGHRAEVHADESSASVVDWRIFRGTNRIDIDNLSAHTGETWQRDGKVLIMRKLFHDDRNAIEYQMDDFSVLAMKPSWRKQALLIDPALLSQLTPVGERWIDGHPARTYRGSLGAQKIEIIWLVDINLPQSIVRSDSAGDLIEQTTLVALQPLTGQRWTCRCGEGYEIIDYADLGDRERDQFVMRVQSQLPGGNVHRH